MKASTDYIRGGEVKSRWFFTIAKRRNCPRGQCGPKAAPRIRTPRKTLPITTKGCNHMVAPPLFNFEFRLLWNQFSFSLLIFYSKDVIDVLHVSSEFHFTYYVNTFLHLSSVFRIPFHKQCFQVLPFFLMMFCLFDCSCQ